MRPWRHTAFEMLSCMITTLATYYMISFAPPSFVGPGIVVANKYSSISPPVVERPPQGKWKKETNQYNNQDLAYQDIPRGFYARRGGPIFPRWPLARTRKAHFLEPPSLCPPLLLFPSFWPDFPELPSLFCRAARAALLANSSYRPSCSVSQKHPPKHRGREASLSSMVLPFLPWPCGSCPLLLRPSFLCPCFRLLMMMNWSIILKLRGVKVYLCTGRLSSPRCVRGRRL